MHLALKTILLFAKSALFIKPWRQVLTDPVWVAWDLIFLKFYDSSSFSSVQNAPLNPLTPHFVAQRLVIDDAEQFFLKSNGIRCFFPPGNALDLVCQRGPNFPAVGGGVRWGAADVAGCRLYQDRQVYSQGSVVGEVEEGGCIVGELEAWIGA